MQVEKLYLWSISICFFFLVGCTNNEGVDVACDVLLEPALAELDLTTMSPDTIETWILNNYDVEVFDLLRYTVPPDRFGVTYTGGVSWQTPERHYSGDFLDDELQRVNMTWKHRRETPSIQSVLSCLGSPDYYSALYHHSAPEDRLEIRLYYPDKGIVVWIVDYSVSPEPPIIKVTDAISRMAITLPGTPTNLNHTGDALLTLQFEQKINDIIKPWPGSWEDMEIVVDLTYTPPTP